MKPFFACLILAVVLMTGGVRAKGATYQLARLRGFAPRILDFALA
jgi:hypothetical protein